MFYQKIKGQDTQGKDIEICYPGVGNLNLVNYEGFNPPGANQKASNPVSASTATGLCEWTTINDQHQVTLVGPNTFYGMQSSSTLNNEIFSGIKTSNAPSSSISQHSRNLRLVMRNYPDYGIVLFFENNFETQLSPQALRIRPVSTDEFGSITWEMSKVALSSIPKFSTGYTYQLHSNWIKSMDVNTYQNAREWQAPIMIRDSNGFYILKVISETYDGTQYVTGLTLIPIANSKNYVTDLGFFGINGEWYYQTFDSSLEQIKSEMSDMSNKYISR